MHQQRLLFRLCEWSKQASTLHLSNRTTEEHPFLVLFASLLQATMVKLFGPIGKYVHYIFSKYTTTYRNNEFYRILDLNFFR